MPYETLVKLAYTTPDGAASEYQKRVSAPGTYFFTLGHQQYFYCTLPQTEAVVEEIIQTERTIDTVWRTLPTVASQSFLTSLLINEVMQSNDIEGVRSTRREVQEALVKPHARLATFARLLEALAQDTVRPPETLQDIRHTYDQITRGEIATDDLPDGEFFRKGPVQVMSAAQKELHRGIYPEQAIIQGLSTMLKLLQHPFGSRLVAAVLSHLMFEIIHPFYDGNGRTGRYLLAVFMRTVLSPYTALAISSQINNRKQEYYRAFEQVEHRLNQGECTHFVLTMLNIIHDAQQNVLQLLIPRQKALQSAKEAINKLAPITGRPIELNVAFVLAQAYLFAEDRTVELDVIAHTCDVTKQTVRPILRALENKGFVTVATRRPLRFALTSVAAAQLKIPEQL